MISSCDLSTQIQWHVKALNQIFDLFIKILFQVAAKKLTLKNVTDYIVDIISKRAEDNYNYGVILIPEGLIDFIPEVDITLHKKVILVVFQPEILNDVLASVHVQRIWACIPIILIFIFYTFAGPTPYCRTQ